MAPGFYLIMAAQFASALADNALLIVAIDYLEQTGHPAWWAPLLKLFFTFAYVALAPMVGPLADGGPKARLMAWMNGVKILGVVALAVGLHPLAAFAVVGVGAAGYAPAKYGLVTEIVPATSLVRANAWIEASVVGAVLLGTGLGGLLVSDMVRLGTPQAWTAWLSATGIAQGSTLGATFLVLLMMYVLAAALHIGIPDSGARYARQSVRPAALWTQFQRANTALWRDPHGGRTSLAVTTLFWGAGAVLQFAVLRYATDVLALPLSQGAYLQAVVALGVALGAWAAGRFIALESAMRVLPMGVALGLLVIAGTVVNGVSQLVPVMALIGVVGGVLVVPMNALLQHRGHVLLTAGRSIAVQGFNENASVLLGLGLYATLLRMDASIIDVMIGLGATLSVSMALLALRRRAVHG